MPSFPEERQCFFDSSTKMNLEKEPEHPVWSSTLVSFQNVCHYDNLCCGGGLAVSKITSLGGISKRLATDVGRINCFIKWFSPLPLGVSNSITKFPRSRDSHMAFVGQ